MQLKKTTDTGLSFLTKAYIVKLEESVDVVEILGLSKRDIVYHWYKLIGRKDMK